MSAPKISILIPTYKRPAFLREAIASVFAQGLADLEVIVGDDGEDGRAIVEGYGDERLRYVNHGARLGNPGNSNVLLDLARAPYLALLNDDDRLLPGFLTATLAVLDRNQDIGVAFTNHLIEFSNTTIVRRCDLASGRHAHFAYDLLRHQPVACSAAVFRRECWASARPLPTDTRVSDHVLFARIAEANWPFYYVDEPLMVYREHDSNISRDVGHRKDVVVAWRAFQFHDAAAEGLRRRYLADALIGRASVLLREGDRDAARNDFEEAVALGPSSRARAILIAWLVRRAGYARLAAGLGDRLTWRPWARHEPVTARRRRPPRWPWLGQPSPVDGGHGRAVSSAAALRRRRPDELAAPAHPKSTLPSVSVVMATHNRAHMLPGVLRPLLADSATTELVIAVDGSTDGSLELLRKLADEDERVQILALAGYGATRAQQAALDRATGQVALVIDDDVMAYDGLVTGHARYHADSPDTVVVGYMPTVQPSRRYPGNFPSFFYHDQYEAHCAAWEETPDRVLRTLWGGNVSYNREQLLGLGGLRASVSLNYHYDLELGLRCESVRLKGVFDRRLCAVHLHKRGVDRFLSEARGAGEDQAAIQALHPRLFNHAESGNLRPVLRWLIAIAARDSLHGVTLPLLRKVVSLAGRAGFFELESRLGFGLKLIQFQRGFSQPSARSFPPER